MRRISTNIEQSAFSRVFPTKNMGHHIHSIEVRRLSGACIPSGNRAIQPSRHIRLQIFYTDNGRVTRIGHLADFRWEQPLQDPRYKTNKNREHVASGKIQNNGFEVEQAGDRLRQAGNLKHCPVNSETCSEELNTVALTPQSILHAGTVLE